MLEKELETAFKKELYELALTDSSSRDDKYHEEGKMVNAIPLRDIIDYKTPKGLFNHKPEKKQKRKKVIKRVVKKEVKEAKEVIIQIPEQKTHTVEVKYIQTKDTVLNKSKDNEEMLNIPSYCILVQSLEERITSIQMYGVYFLKNQKFGLSDVFISKLNKAMNRNQLIIIDNDDDELRNFMESHNYYNYLLIKGEVTDSHHIALSRREILEQVHTFVLDMQKINERLLTVKLFFKHIGKIGEFLVTKEVSANW